MPQPSPTPEQRVADSWLNAMPNLAQQRSREIEELVHREISLHFMAIQEPPVQIRMNPLAIFQMEGERWYSFPFLAETHAIIGIPVVPDPHVSFNEVRCVGRDDTMMAAKSAGKQC